MQLFVLNKFHQIVLGWLCAMMSQIRACLPSIRRYAGKVRLMIQRLGYHQERWIAHSGKNSCCIFSTFAYVFVLFCDYRLY